MPGSLRRLTIEDYGLIARAQIEFAAGATMFTGETVSGKTMVLGALGFVLGDRAGAGAVRRGAPRAVVTLEFEPSDPLRERLGRDGYELDPGEDAVLARELSENGKSALRLNGRPATAAYVREMATSIADVVGQHDAQRLLAPAYQVELLDRFAGDPAERARERVAAAHESVQALAQRLHVLDGDERRAEEQLAFARFALDEIEKSAPAAGEEEPLMRRRHLLDNVERVASALRAAHQALAGGESCAGDALGDASAALRGIAEIGGNLAEMAGQAAALQSEANDLSLRVARELESTEFDPADLEKINARLDVLDRLKRKYGGSIEAVLASAAEFASTVELCGDRGERRAQIRAELDAARAQLREEAAELARLRRAAAKHLRGAMLPELADLALPSARFDVRFEVLPEIGPGGAERLEFVFAANKGEPEGPLARIASGGELSRVLLALVVVLAASREPTALVFDEIDTGIGGATATAVGVRLGRLATAAQVVSVTHLAQIATWADCHYVLEKIERRGGTTIELRRADTVPERTSELARMLSGEAHDAAVRHAAALLDQTKRRRATT